MLTVQPSHIIWKKYLIQSGKKVQISVLNTKLSLPLTRSYIHTPVYTGLTPFILLKLLLEGN